MAGPFGGINPVNLISGGISFFANLSKPHPSANPLVHVLAAAGATAVGFARVAAQPAATYTSRSQYETANAAARAATIANAQEIQQKKNYGDGQRAGAPVIPVVPDNYHTGIALSKNDLEYNTGMIGSSYLGAKFEKLTGQLNDTPNPITGANLPDHFKKAGQYKGMIITYIPENSENLQKMVPNGVGGESNLEQKRYGFQFHYNPTDLVMSYTGQPEISLGYAAAGTDPFHPAGSAMSQSTISVKVPINRIEDFKYYDDKTQQLKAGVSPAIYKGKLPTITDQKRIYGYGTMYDVEYLLATCLGYKMVTQHRDMTSDLGYVSGQIVEVFLGNRLKYLAMMTGVTVNHVMFDERMVPIFSTLSFDMSIVPDFPGV
jgi:hypothetical protein